MTIEETAPRAAADARVPEPRRAAEAQGAASAGTPAPLLVLWDIDQTLIDGGAVGRRACAAAFRAGDRPHARTSVAVRRPHRAGRRDRGISPAPRPYSAR